MRFSIWPDVGDWRAVADTVAHAEATGWDRAYVADHFMDDGESADSPTLTPTLEATALLAGLAATTSRIGLGSLVLGATYRHPAVVANWAATVDRMSAGRLILGLGAGWQVNEHEQYGIELSPRATRVARFAEALPVIRGLLDQRETTFDGRYYRLTRATSEPKPTQAHVPILVGAKGDRMLDVVARHADEWNMWGLPPLIAARRAVLDRACERHGRDPAEIATSCQALWYVTATAEQGDDLVARGGGRAAVGGPVDRLAEHVAAWRDAGVDEVIVPTFTMGAGPARADTMDAIIEQVAPLFRP